MALDNTISLKGPSVNFSMHYLNFNESLSDVFRTDANGYIILVLSNHKMTFKVTLSPRTIALFLWQALIFRTAKMIPSLELNRTDFSDSFSEVIGHVVASRSFADINEAWNYDPTWPDLVVEMAEQKYMDIFRTCAYFEMDDIRCRLGPSCIEIRQRIFMEHITSFTEWRKNVKGGTQDEYISDISDGDGDWRVTAPIFTLRLSYYDLSYHFHIRVT